MTREEQIYEVFKLLIHRQPNLNSKVMAAEAVTMIDDLEAAIEFRNRRKQRESQEPVWETLNLTVRTGNCLKGEDIRTLEELCSKKEIDLLKIPNLGRRSLNEIREALAQRGMMLR